MLGGGHQGLSMAAHLALNNEQVYLWNRTQDHIKEILETNQIHSSGVVNGCARIQKASSCIDDVMTNVIMVTTPANAHKDIARMLAKRVAKDCVIILNPGRTFGAMEFANVLIEEGCKELPHIAETQTIVYTCRRSECNSTVIYTLKRDVYIAALNCDDIGLVISSIPECIRERFVPAKSVIQTSLSNVGMVLHCSPVLMNIGWIESNIVEFKYYYDGISPSIARFIERIDEERLAVAGAFGYQLETTAEWMRRTYGTAGSSLYECIQNNKYYKEIDAPHTIRHRYLEEDVPCGLVPLESAGKYAGVITPYTSLVIDLANAIMDCDFRTTGRKYREIK